MPRDQLEIRRPKPKSLKVTVFRIWHLHATYAIPAATFKNNLESYVYIIDDWHRRSWCLCTESLTGVVTITSLVFCFKGRSSRTNYALPLSSVYYYFFFPP